MFSFFSKSSKKKNGNESEIQLPIVVEDTPYEGEFSKHNLQGFDIKSSLDLHEIEAKVQTETAEVKCIQKEDKSTKFKKKKTLKKIARKHYMKHLGGGRDVRFKKWNREQLVYALIHYKNFHLRHESSIDTEALRVKCEELFEDDDLPDLPPPIAFDTLVRLILVVTRIQHRWTCYLWQKKLQQEEAEISRVGDAVAAGDVPELNSSMYDLNVAPSSTPVNHQEVVQAVPFEPESNLGVSEETAAREQRRRMEEAFRARHRTILDIPWKPPSISEAKLNADYVHPRDHNKRKFDYWQTSTGRHCCLFSELREQFDLWNEGEDSAFAAFGPGITNYFKFLKWAFWVFFLLSIAAIPCLVLNASGDSQVMGLSSIARTTIGNLAVRSAGYVYYNNATGAFEYNSTFNNLVATEVNIRLPGCTDYGEGTKATCYLDAESLALFYAAIDLVVSVIIFVAYVWLAYFEKVEEQSLTANKYLISDYTVMVTGFAPSTTEDDIRAHFNRLVSKNKLNVVADVVFAYNNRSEIVLFKRRGDLVRKKKHLTFEYQRKFTRLKHNQALAIQRQEEIQQILRNHQSKLNASKNATAEGVSTPRSSKSGKSRKHRSQKHAPSRQQTVISIPPPVLPPALPMLTDEEMEAKREDLFKEFRIKVFHLDKELTTVNQRLQHLTAIAASTTNSPTSASPRHSSRDPDDDEYEDVENEDDSGSASPVSIHPIAAFVTFHYITDQQLTLNKYRYYSIKSLFFGDKELLLNGARLRVAPAPEPSVIVWENLEFSWWDRFVRRAFTFTISLLFIVFTLVMIFASKYVEQKSLSNGSNTLDLCPTNFFTFSEEQQQAIVHTYPSLMYCYCDDLETSATDATCRNYYVQLGQAQVLTYFASFIVIVVNNLMERALRWAAQFELHRSLDGLSMSIFLRLFVLKYINTAAVFFINSNKTILQHVFGLHSDDSALEFGTTWYNTVAVTIVLVQLGDIFNAHSRSAMQYFFLQQRKEAFQRVAVDPNLTGTAAAATGETAPNPTADSSDDAEELEDVELGAKSPSGGKSLPRKPSSWLFQLLPEAQQRAYESHLYEKALTQEEMNQLVMGPDFEFAFNYAQIMSTFFVCLTFSTGIPILYPIAAFNFLLFYFMEKYMFIHLYKIPPHFTTLVGRRATRLIPVALLLHLSMSIWMLSNNELFSSAAYNNGDVSSASGDGAAEHGSVLSSWSFGTTLERKLTGTATLPLFLMLLAVVVVHFLYWYCLQATHFVRRAVDFFFGSCIQQCLEKSIVLQHRTKKRPFLQCMRAGNFEGVLSYNLLYNVEYKKAFESAWHYIVSNGDIRVMYAMKLRAKTSREDEDYRLAEKLIRRAIVKRIEARSNIQHVRPVVPHLTPLNHSFYHKLASAASDVLDAFEQEQLAVAAAQHSPQLLANSDRGSPAGRPSLLNRSSSSLSSVEIDAAGMSPDVNSPVQPFVHQYSHDDTQDDGNGLYTNYTSLQSSSSGSVPVPVRLTTPVRTQQPSYPHEGHYSHPPHQTQSFHRPMTRSHHPAPHMMQPHRMGPPPSTAGMYSQQPFHMSSEPRQSYH